MKAGLKILFAVMQVRVRFPSVYRGDTVIASDASFIIKTDTSGTPRWMRGYIGTTICGIDGITLMPGNKIAAVGEIAGQIIGGSDTIISYSGEGWNPFFTVLDTAGYVTNLQQIHGSGFYDNGTSIASDRIGNLYIGGQVATAVWADTITHYTSVGGNTDFFVLKYGVECSCTSMPVATATISATGTGGATVAFTYTGTTSGIDSMRWYFGDGSATSTATSPTHTYSTVGTFYACVYIYSSCGNDVHCTNITIPCLSAPTAAFTSTGTTAVRSFTYTSATTGLDSVSWAFGDGSHGSGFLSTHTYTATGTFTVCATAYNPCGNNSVCHTVTIPCLTAPTASYTSSGATNIRNFSYTGTTTGLDSVVWHYGDGGRGTGTTATHTYLLTGTFTVCALAYSPCGIDSSCNTVTIPCTTHPTAAFTHSGTPTVAFSYTGTTTGLDSVVWHYGDGGRGTGTTSTHNYTTIGSYTACVVAYNHCGSDSTCSTISIPCLTPPSASFTNTTIIRGSYIDTFNYGGTSVGLDSIVWHYGDGGNGAGFNTAHTFAGPGTYTVCVVAYSPCGWDSSCYTVIVPCDTPVASFSHTGVLPVNFAYTGTSTHLDSVVWVYGDGVHGTGTTSSHSYTASGIYTACVIAYGMCAVDSACDTIHVLGTGVQKLALPTIQVYPNPVTADELYIKDVTELICFRLLNVAGVSLQQGILHKGINTLTMGNYASGIYLLELIGDDGQKDMVRVVKE